MIHPEKQTALIPIENISTVPIAIFAGIHDTIADMEDALWIKDTLKPEVLVDFEQIEAGHLTFMVGKDMTYWSTNVMGLLAQYHPIPGTEEVSELEIAEFLQ